MVYLIYGENTVQRQERIADIVRDATVRRVDGANLTPGDLPELFRGNDMFAQNQVTVVSQASENSVVWAAIPEYLQQSDDAIIFYEQRVDKRTATYKSFAKHGTVIECAWPTVRDASVVASWLRTELQTHDSSASREVINHMIDRATRVDAKSNKPIIDVQQLQTVVEQCVGMTITVEIVDSVLPQSSYENVFELLGLMLSGKTDQLTGMLQRLKQHEDPYRLLALLATQVTNLAALTLSTASAKAVANDLGVHPYTLTSLDRYAKHLSRHDVRMIVDALATADTQMKSGADAWQVFEHSVQHIVTLMKKRPS